MIGIKIGAMNKIPLGTYYGLYKGCLEGSTDVNKYDKIEGLLPGV